MTTPPCLSETSACSRLLPCPAKEQWLEFTERGKEKSVEWLADRCREIYQAKVRAREGKR